MTISNTSRTAGPFIGNGITKDFPFSYKVFARSDVLVAQTIRATGVETLKALDADYSVTLNVNQDTNPGGVISMFVAPPAGSTLAATSNIELVQSLDLTNQGGFYPKVINDALDRMVIIIQQLAGKIGQGLGIGQAAITDAALSALALVQQMDEVDLMSFIPPAERAAIIAKTSQYDASGDIARAIAFCSALPNGTRLVAPRGKFRCSKAVPFKSNVTLVGKAKMATEFEFTHTGDGFVSSNSINSSTAANIALEQCSVTCTNALNTGGGFVDVGGTFVDLYKVRFSGWKYNTILDQTEIATIDLCDSLQAAYSVAGLWLVNGPDHTPTAKTIFTNRITVTRCQFNAADGAQCNVLDDGGSNHSYRDNNFNGGATGIRASGVAGLTIDNNEMEGHTGEDIYLGDTTLSGAFVGPCHGFSLRDNVPISGSGGRNVTIQNAMTGTITGNVFGQAAAAINFINGAANQATGIVIEANSKIITGAARTSGIFVSGFSRSSRQNALRQGAVTYVPLATAAGAVTLTPAAMEFITLGTRLHVSSEDGTNGEDTIVTAVTAATFTCALVSAKSANFVVRGATPQNSEEEGSWTPSIGATGTSGAHTYSVQAGQYTRRGNVIHVTGSIEVSAKDVALNGAIQIKGLPYVAEAVLNGNSFANISLFGGFTFPAGYTHMAGIIFPGSSAIDLRRSGSGSGLSTVSNSEIPGSTLSLYFEATYLTSAS